MGTTTTNEINDGYTLDGFIKEEPRLYRETNFRYRPILFIEQKAIVHKLGKMDGANYARFALEVLVKYLVEWDVKDRAGAVVVRTAGEINKHVPPALCDRLLDVICGLRGPDANPSTPASPSDGAAGADSASELDALLEGTTTEARRESADLKNSSAG